MNNEIKTKLTEIFSHGIVAGLGEPEPGKMCIEAAVCFALGEPHSDKPSCVAREDRIFAIGLNDSNWSSDKARAEAMLPLALAQLGTAGTDRSEWVRRVVEGTIRRVVPLALRAAAEKNPSYAASLDEAAVRCATEGTREAAHEADRAADAAHEAYRAASAAHYATRANALFDAAYAAYYAATASSADAAHYATIVTGNDEPLRMAIEIALEAYRA